MRHVTIVGAGLAGMTAALRLLERGFHVRLYEQDWFPGGMIHSYMDEDLDTWREHGYHMLPNFYFNFWKVAEELGLQDRFVPREGMKFLGAHDRLGHLPAMYNPSGPQDFLRNLTSGAETPPDLFIYMYSMIDILAQAPDDRLDEVGVTGFLHGRPYMTEEAMQLHRTMWQTVWGISSDQASLKSYRAFIKYSNHYSVPEFWFLAGNKWDNLIKPWFDRLQSFGEQFEWHPNRLLQQVDVAGNSIESLVFRRTVGAPSLDPGAPCDPDGHPEFDVVDVQDDAVIFAVSPGAIKDIVHGDLYRADPKLGEVQYLSADPLGNLQLRITKPMHLPKDITEFPGAPYSLTFLDFTQIWRDLEPANETLLNVSISDVTGLLSLEPERRDPHTHELILNLNEPSTAIEYVLKVVLERLPEIRLEDIDLRRTVYDVLTGEQLFANLAGSWSHRPETTTAISNLWLAGTYVRNVIDVATIEGAVMTGAMAAEAIRAQRAPEQTPVTVLEPEEFPVEMYQALRVAWLPYVTAAKMWASTNQWMGGTGLGWNRLQHQMIAAGAEMVKPFLGRVPNPPEYLGPMTWPGTTRDLPPGHPLAIGPVYWQYNSDGTRKAHVAHGAGH